MDANDECRMCETIADNLRAESDGWQNRYDLKCVEFDKMQEYYETREDVQFATTEENAALRAVNKEIRKHVVAYQQAWDSKDLHNRISQIVFEKSYGEEFESAYRKLQEENAALQARIAQLEASAATLPPAVPEGMQLVPVSMSEVMQESVANILQRCIGQNNGTPSECSYEWADEMHKAMIDAVKGETA